MSNTDLSVKIPSEIRDYANLFALMSLFVTIPGILATLRENSDDFLIDIGIISSVCLFIIFSIYTFVSIANEIDTKHMSNNKLFSFRDSILISVGILFYFTSYTLVYTFLSSLEQPLPAVTFFITLVVISAYIYVRNGKISVFIFRIVLDLATFIILYGIFLISLSDTSIPFVDDIFSNIIQFDPNIFLILVIAPLVILWIVIPFVSLISIYKFISDRLSYLTDFSPDQIDIQ